MRLVVGVLTSVVCLLAAGCARAEPESYQTGPRDLVLQLFEIPAVVDPGEPASLVPTFSLYGDGRVVIAEPGNEDGALPRIRQLQLSEARVQQLVTSALDADVQDNAEKDINIRPGAPTLVMTLQAEERFGWTELGPEVGGQLGNLRDSLLAYTERQGAQPYQHEAIAVLATPTAPQSGSRPWPLPEIRPSAERKVSDALCTTYRKTAVEDVTATARGAEPNQVWTSGADSFRVSFRPMLPHETDCDSLAVDHRERAEKQQ